MKVKILHNPRCSKSRQSLSLLEEQNCDIDIIPYLTVTPSIEELDTIIKLLGCSVKDLIRTGEKEFKALNVKLDDLSPADCLELLVTKPILIQRPIVIAGNKARIGRPPETILDIL